MSVTTLQEFTDYFLDNYQINMIVNSLDTELTFKFLRQISDIHKEGCTLKWNPPLDDGGAPIDHYVVEKLDTETGR